MILALSRLTRFARWQTENYDAHILALATLLSSHVLYNYRNLFDRATMDELGLVLNVVRDVLRSAQGDSDGSLPRDTLPSFTMVLRDSEYTMTMEPSEQMRKTLTAIAKDPSYTSAVDCLRNSFADHFCFMLQPPSRDAAKLQRLPECSDAELNARFVREFGELAAHVHRLARPKRFQGQTATGHMLGSMLRCYVNAINSGTKTLLEDAWTAAMNDQLRVGAWRLLRHALSFVPLTLDGACSWRWTRQG